VRDFTPAEPGSDHFHIDFTCTACGLQDRRRVERTDLESQLRQSE
jgi:hypothetical protein